jgi:undecaprenyl-phosphate galactose phosphotransferase
VNIKTATAEADVATFDSESIAKRRWTQVASRCSPQTWLGLLFVGSDILSILLSLLISGLATAAVTYLAFNHYYLEEGVPGGMLRLAYVTMIGAGVVTVLATRGHYRCGVPLHRELQQVVMVLLFAMLFESFIHYAQKVDFSRLWLVSTWVIAVPIMLVGRGFVKAFVTKHDSWKIPVVVVGDGAAIGNALTLFQAEYQMGFRTVSKLQMEAGAPFDQADFLRLRDAVGPWKGAHVVFARHFPFDPGIGAALRYLNTERIPYSVLAPLQEMSILNLEILPLYRNEMVLLSANHGSKRFESVMVKRFVDVLMAGVGLIVTFPLLVLIGMAVSRDGGPVFYGHGRVGRHGRKFNCYKFRTMATDGDALLRKHLSENPDAAAEWSKTHKLFYDPRVTRIGRMLRKTSLDELPQLINIIKGDMSVVGPRPVTEAELRDFGETRDYYLKMRPGVTGLWQISGRSSTTYERRIYLDGWYARNWSFWHDMAIILRTVPVVLMSKGAV